MFSMIKFFFIIIQIFQFQEVRCFNQIPGNAIRNSYWNSNNIRNCYMSSTLKKISSLPKHVLTNHPKTLTTLSKLKEKHDNVLEKFFIYILSWFLTCRFPQQGTKKYIFVGMDFKDFVYFTKTLFETGDVEIIHERIVIALKSIIPEILRTSFRKIFLSSPKFISEKSSLWMKFGLLSWLVGPSERFHIDVETTDGKTESWKSGVKLIECRYLMQSGCKSTCLHLCKTPTQAFFKDELGFPVYLKPNFEDFSCEMHFGVNPPPIESDPAFQEACYDNCRALKYTKHKI